MESIEPRRAQMGAFRAAADADPAPVTMLNLLRYRATADYRDHPDETPCSGRQAYQRYAAEALACVEAAGGNVVFAGATAASLIGPEGEAWDDILLVEYPSRRALIDMLESARYQAIVHHRSAALADSRLVPITAGTLTFQD